MQHPVPPKVSVKSKYISVSLGEQLDIDCLVEAFPKPTNYWSRKPAIKTDTSVAVAAAAALSMSTRNNNGFINNDHDDESLTLSHRSAATMPKRKQMAIYEQVTAAQMDDNNGQLITMPTRASTPETTHLLRNVATFAKSSMPSRDGLVVEHSEDNASAADDNNNNDSDKDKTNNSLYQRQSVREYNIDNNFNDNFRRIRHNSYTPSNSESSTSRHNFQQRLKLRQVVMPMMINSDLDSGLLEAPTTTTTVTALSATETGASNGSNENLTSAYVTVKQTAVNAYTYKLRLSIARVQPDDFGGYVCISSNSLGASQEYTFVTRKYIFDASLGHKALSANQWTTN